MLYNFYTCIILLGHVSRVQEAVHTDSSVLVRAMLIVVGL